jgi:hypothetical protein
VSEHIFALLARDGERLAPVCQLRLLDDLENAAERKVVVTLRRRVHRVAVQFARRDVERRHAVAERAQRLGPVMRLRSCELPFR